MANTPTNTAEQFYTELQAAKEAAMRFVRTTRETEPDLRNRRHLLLDYYMYHCEQLDHRRQVISTIRGNNFLVASHNAALQQHQAKMEIAFQEALINQIELNQQKKNHETNP